ncbi:MAG: hypothetical protein AAF289_08865 [Cyanobacteria bacterium P01_A01_bin.135]
MAAATDVSLNLVLEDSDLDPGEVEALTQSLKQQLAAIAEDVERVPAKRVTRGNVVEKGDKNEPGLLHMEVNLANIQKLAGWLYQRLAGRSTKARIKYGEGPDAVEFEFEGNSQKDLAATMQDFTAFVERVAQIQQSKK